MWGPPEKFGGWGIPIRSAAWLLATQYGEYLLKTLCRRKHDPEKTNEAMKRVPVERQCISRYAPCLQLFCHALILLSSAGNHCPRGSCLGSFLKDLWVQAVLCVWGSWGITASGPAGWQSLESSVRPDLQPLLLPAATALQLAAIVENEKHHFYILNSV